MRAITVEPKKANSAAIVELPEPVVPEGHALVETIVIGVCGTDGEILRGEYGWPPEGKQRLVIGHEALGRVIEPGDAAGRLKPGDLVAPMVRRPDPIPCINCAVGEWDMCRNGLYTEHGIKGVDGFAVERFAVEPNRLVKIDPQLGELGVLLEPASILAKAWEQVERIGARSPWAPQRALITGAGPIGLLAAMMARQRGLEIDVLDRVADGPKPALVERLGGRYHTGSVAAIERRPDVALECTGSGQLVFDVMNATAACGIVCLTGVSSGGRKISIDMGGLNQNMVLENDVVFGSVNANQRHYEAAADSLARADRDWLAGLIARRVPLDHWQDAFVRQPNDVKTIIAFHS